MRAALIALALCAATLRPAAAQERMAFWNLTSFTITNLVMAPVGAEGAGAFGPNQCANDKDGTVDHDERLRLTGIKPGRYDVQLTTKPGRVCTVHGVEVKGGGRYSFSLSDADLKECR